MPSTSPSGTSGKMPPKPRIFLFQLPQEESPPPPRILNFGLGSGTNWTAKDVAQGDSMLGQSGSSAW